ncbi:hypothetical protein D3C80_1601070 [compost metagenome]
MERQINPDMRQMPLQPVSNCRTVMHIGRVRHPVLQMTQNAWQIRGTSWNTITGHCPEHTLGRQVASRSAEHPYIELIGHKGHCLLNDALYGTAPP